MSAIGEFTAQLSHEIRNPLTSIKLNLQRLNRGVEDSRIPQEYAKAVRLCLREVKRLDGTVRGVLSVARTRPPRHDPVSLHDVIRAALEVLSPQLEDRAIEVVTELAALEDTVLGDREQLEGAFLNLFLNSAEAMGEGGTLRVATSSCRTSGNELGSEAARCDSRPGIRVRIADEGPGVPEELRDRIYDPFFTTKEGGTGFGLPVAVRVMEEHRGTLMLQPADTSKAGAVFEIVLPVTQAGAE
jgi:signal transduction histidine kinase